MMSTCTIQPLRELRQWPAYLAMAARHAPERRERDRARAALRRELGTEDELRAERARVTEEMAELDPASDTYVDDLEAVLDDLDALDRMIEEAHEFRRLARRFVRFVASARPIRRAARRPRRRAHRVARRTVALAPDDGPAPNPDAPLVAAGGAPS